MANKQYQYNQSAANRLEYDGARIVMCKYTVADNTKTYQKGQVVKLTATAGEIDFAGGSDFPFGIVQIANNPTDPNGDSEMINTVTVREFSVDHTEGYAEENILASGTLLNANGVQVGDETYTKYLVALPGTYASAIALQSATLGEKMRIAILSAPVLIP